MSIINQRKYKIVITFHVAIKEKHLTIFLKKRLILSVVGNATDIIVKTFTLLSFKGEIFGYVYQNILFGMSIELSCSERLILKVK